MRPDRLTLVAALALLVAPSARGGQDDARTPPPREEPPVYIFLNSPADLDAFLKRLANPDFTLRSGIGPDALNNRDRSAEPSPGIVESVAIEGEVRGDLAHLTIDYGLTVTGSEAHLVPIRLDGQTVEEIAEKDRELPHQVGKDGGWSVEVTGDGRHDVRVKAVVPVRRSTDGWRLELTIPEAAKTRFQVLLPTAAIDAMAGPTEPVAIESVEGGKKSRLRASLAPRRRLDLSWRVPAEAGAQGPPLLVAQGDLALDIDRAALRANATWSVRSERGTTRSLAVHLEPGDELLGVAVDGLALPLDEPPAKGILTIPLPRPLRPGGSLRLAITIRRPISVGAGETLKLRGFPISDAISQSGVIALAKSGDDIWISGEAGRGLRPIDPRNDLPADLRARPNTVLAYQFLEQPFDLGLRVDRSRPWVRVETRTTVLLEPSRARLDTWLDYQVSRGRIFEVRVGLPKGLELDSIGPDSVVASSLEQGVASEGSGSASASAERTLVVQLTPRARDDGAFHLHLGGRQPIDASKRVSVGLFQAREATDRGGKIAVVASRNLVADLADDTAGAFAPAGLEPPSDWAWPAEHSSVLWPLALWLRRDGRSSDLPLRLTAYPRTVQHETTLNVRIDRRRVELRQDTLCQVQHGTLTYVDVAIPQALEGRWEIEGTEVVTREPLGRGPDRDERFRLRLAREVTDAVLLRFRSRAPIEHELPADRSTRVAIPRIRILDGTVSAAEILVTADSAIRIEGSTAEGWRKVSDEDASRATGDGMAPRLILKGRRSINPSVLATALPPASLPATVVPRLLLRTQVGLDGDRQTAATLWVDSYGPALDVALPTGARWTRAWVGTDPAEVQQLPGPERYRVKLGPGLGAGPWIVRFEYSEPTRSSTAVFRPPVLLGDGRIEQTLWEVHIPWNQALVGVPEGWADENDWYWDRYVWKRRPVRDAAGLGEWAGATAARAKGGNGVPDEDRGGYHAYLFGRPGEPTSLRPMIVSRAVLIGMCSGAVLGVGLLMLTWRPSLRIIGPMTLALALAMVAASDPSVALLAIQSSAVGLALVVVAAVTQRIVERRRPSRPMFEGSGLGATASTSSSPREAVVGSSESTVIRPRPGTTVDHAPLEASLENVAADEVR